MNFKFKDNLENNTMVVHVNLKQRKKMNEPKVRIFLQDVLELIEVHYNPPKTHTLGKLVSNMHMKLDNTYAGTCTGKWVFSLIPNIKEQPKPSPRKRSTKKSKTK